MFGLDQTNGFYRFKMCIIANIIDMAKIWFGMYFALVQCKVGRSLNTKTKVTQQIKRSIIHEVSAAMSDDKTDKIFLLKIAGFLAILIVGWGFILAAGIMGKVFGTCLVGIMFAHAVELQHESIHGAGFQFKGINRTLGFILGIPMFVSFSHYKLEHLKHHKLLGTNDNKEFFDYGDAREISFLKKFVHSVTLHRYQNVISNMRKALLGQDFAENKKKSEHIRKEYIFILIILLASVGFSLMFKSYLLLQLWLMPSLLVAELVHFMIELPEHFNCETNSTYVPDNTRTIRGSNFSFWLTNGNNFHVEHHLFPQVPISKLPKIHRQLLPHLTNYNSSYFDFFKELTFNAGKRP